MLEVCDCLALMRLSLAAMTAAVLLGVAAPAKAEIVSTKCTLTHHKKNTNSTVNCRWRQSQGNVQAWVEGRNEPYRFKAKGQGKNYVRINNMDRITLTRIGQFTLTIWQGQQCRTLSRDDVC